MKFDFSRYGLEAKEEMLERLFEIMPGLCSWSILLGVTALSILKPLAAAVFIIAFDLYWIFKLFYMNIFLVLSYIRLSVEDKTDWMMRIRGLDNLEAYSEKLHVSLLKSTLKEKASFIIHQFQVEKLRKSDSKPAPSQDLYHLVIIPIAREPREIVEPGVESIGKGEFPAKRILVILALEERAKPDVKKAIYDLQKEHTNEFLDLLVVEHPDGLPQEAKVKGANATYAAKKAAEYFREKNIPFENIIASCFDADTVVNPDYFSCLTYNFMVEPNRHYISFQPIPVYHNNIWEAPSFARVLDVGSSFFQLIEATNPDKLVTFSSHSMSFKALVDVGFWPVDMISDDSAIYWKALIHYDGRYSAMPLYVKLSMDVATGKSWWETFLNVYKQKRRWAWGVENFPIVTRAFLKDKNISTNRKIRYAFKLFEGHISWATWPFLLTLIGWLPVLLAGREFTQTTVYYIVPRITGTIFKLASLGLLSCIFLSVLLLPKQTGQGRAERFSKKIRHVFEWLLVPLVSIFLSAIPALDAQTRLMRGKYMEFWVTLKKRK